MPKKGQQHTQQRTPPSEPVSGTIEARRDRERNNPLVSKDEAISVTSSAQVLGIDLDHLTNNVYIVAGAHHVQAADVLRELQRRITGGR